MMPRQPAQGHTDQWQGANSGRRLLEDERAVDTIFPFNPFSSRRGFLYRCEIGDPLFLLDNNTLSCPPSIGAQAG
jgi:hypothetical protein